MVYLFLFHPGQPEFHVSFRCHVCGCCIHNLFQSCQVHFTPFAWPPLVSTGSQRIRGPAFRTGDMQGCRFRKSPRASPHTGASTYALASAQRALAVAQLAFRDLCFEGAGRRNQSADGGGGSACVGTADAAAAPFVFGLAVCQMALWPSRGRPPTENCSWRFAFGAHSFRAGRKGRQS